MRKKIAIAIMFLMLPSNAWPSACEPFAGEWNLSNHITQEEISALQSLLFGGAYKVLVPRGDVRLKPETTPLADTYSVTMEWKPDLWIFRFFQGDKEAGAWRLKPSKDWTFFQTDPGIPEIAKDAPVLYKEIRVEGRAEPEGIFISEASEPVNFRLIFQGRGSRCFECNDFKRWVFQIEGKDPAAPSQKTVYYSFFGSFEKGC